MFSFRSKNKFYLQDRIACALPRAMALPTSINFLTDFDVSDVWQEIDKIKREQVN